MLETTPNSTNAPHLIAPLQTEAIEVLPGDLGQGIILMCEHASSRIPEHYQGLGLPKSQLNRHIAYDIGAEAVIRELNSQLQAPAIMTRFSRLLIDPNRSLNDPTLIMQLSDGAVIPGNAYISEQETSHRAQTYYKPYHDTLKRLIDESLDNNTPPILLSVHSFTERWKKNMRPWEIGILWDKDPRLPQIFLDELAHILPSHAIGDNEPYSGRLIQDSMYSHATSRGLAHVLIELRQDLIKEEEGQQKWAGRIANIIKKIQNNPEQLKQLQTQKQFGSYTDIDNNI